MTIDIDETPVSSWHDFVQLVTTQLEGRWHFRGCLSHHHLDSGLERAISDWGFALDDAPEIEKRILRDFKRAFPPSAALQLPAREADLDWLALMQHHGAPTRLLDCTYSPYIAAFFALEMLLRSPPREKRKAAIWAVSVTPISNDVIKNMIPAGPLRTHFEELSRLRGGPSFRAVFRDANPPLSFVTPINPFRLNERLIVQQGLFLCAGDVRRPFEANLEAVPGATDPANLKKVILPRSILSEAFLNLRKMNISAASLFPGIDGFARSQYHSIDFLRSVPLFEGTDY